MQDFVTQHQFREMELRFSQYMPLADAYKIRNVQNDKLDIMDICLKNKVDADEVKKQFKRLEETLNKTFQQFSKNEQCKKDREVLTEGIRSLRAQYDYVHTEFSKMKNILHFHSEELKVKVNRQDTENIMN